MPNGRKLGDWGEEMACGFLLRRGFSIVEKNYYTTVGEIDIVAVKGGDFYFLEVKTRASEEMANDSAITPKKKYRFQKTVKKYCYDRNIGGDVGIILAGVIVGVDRIKKTVKFRLAVWR